MKINVLIVFFALISTISFTQTTAIPDANFEQALIDLGIDTNGLNGTILNADAEGVTGTLDVGFNSIADLSGIEAFTAITTLNCHNNSLTSLDLSSNTALETLVCSTNQITTLNVSSNTLLTILNCRANQLASLDVTNNTLLTLLYCYNNGLTDLDVSNNTALTELLSQNNQLVSIDVSKNILLDKGNFSNNSLSSIDVSNNTALTSLFVDQNSISSLDVSKNTGLTTLLCYFNSLTNLNVSKNTALTRLECYNNSLSSLNLSKNVALTKLLCTFNNLTKLDLSQNIALTELNCEQNDLVVLNMKNGNNTNVTSFDANNNPDLLCIQVDDVSYSSTNWINVEVTASFSLDCTYTTAIPDANFEQALIDLGVDTNGLNGNILNADAEVITGSLEMYSKSISDLTGIEAFTNLKTLGLIGNVLTTLDLSHNPFLITVNCYFNNLSSINLASCTSLSDLNLGVNQLSSLDISNNTAITQLVVAANQLTSLDVSQHTSLTVLTAPNNELTSLDVRQNTLLTQLNVLNNQLTSFNVRNGNNSNITTFNAKGNSNLACIEVDDIAYSTTNWIDIDVTSSFSENCNAYIPDDNFEQALIDLGFDTGVLDDYVPLANVEGLTTLDVSNKNITDLTGIEDFVALTELIVSSNVLGSLNLTQNTSLTQLTCINCDLTNLDVTNGNNSNFTIFNLTNNPNLLCIQVDDAIWSAANWADIDDASSFSKDCSLLGVTTYVPGDNFEQALIDLGYDDVLDDNVATANINLITTLVVSQRNIVDLTGIEDFTELTTLNCFANQIASLDVSNNTVLTTLECNSNLLTSIDISKNTALKQLSINYNNLTSIDLSQNTLLYDVIVNNNQLTSLDVSNLPDLFHVYFQNNQLINLNVKNGNNGAIVSFDATGNPNLTCIEVDDVSYSTTNWTSIDAGASFSLDCQYDDDGDGVTNDQEIVESTDPDNGCEYFIASQAAENVTAEWNALDCDCDGTNNEDEISAGTNPILLSAPTGSATQSFCPIDHPTVAQLTATGTDIKWYASIEDVSDLISTTELASGTYYASQTIGSCESDRLAVEVTIESPAVPTGSASQNFCAESNSTVADLVATGTNIQWYAAATGGAALISTAVLTSATNYYASQTIEGCESMRFEVVVTAGDISAPTGSFTQYFCTVNNATVADLEATGTNISWHSAVSGGEVFLSTDVLVGGNYYASQTINGCEGYRMEVVVVVTSDQWIPSSTATQSFCIDSNPTVADLVATGVEIKWYETTTGGTALSVGTALTSGNYYASQTINGCESLRLEVGIIIDDKSAPAGDATQSFCVSDNPTIADLSILGTDIKWYETAEGGTALASAVFLTNSTSYFASQTTSVCGESERIQVVVTIGDSSAPAGAATQRFCFENNPTVADLSATGTSIQWYDDATLATPLLSSAPLTNRTNAHIYASQTIGSCESNQRLEVLVDIITVAGGPTGSISQSFCFNDFPTVDNLTVTGTDVKWYTEAVGGDVLTGSSALISNTSYFASQTTNMCGESVRFEVMVVVDDPTITSSTENIINGQTRALTGSPEGGVFAVVSGSATIIDNVLTTNGEGIIELSYTYGNACEDVQSITVDSNGITGVKQQVISAMKLYPTQTKGNVIIDLGMNYEVVTVGVSNIMGEVETKSTYSDTNQIDVVITGAVGIYFVDVFTSAGERTTFRVFKD